MIFAKIYQKKKRLQPFYILPAQKRHKKEKVTGPAKKEEMLD